MNFKTKITFIIKFLNIKEIKFLEIHMNIKITFKIKLLRIKIIKFPEILRNIKIILIMKFLEINLDLIHHRNNKILIK